MISSAMTRLTAAQRRNHVGRSSRSDGQGLVEFSLVIPIFLVVFIGIIEFSLTLNALLSINFASREAALIAAEAGNATGADCAILQTVEQSITAPANASRITQVRIYQSTQSGALVAGRVNTYVRSSSMSCSFRTGSITVPYTLSGSAGYQDTTRCNVLLGCNGSRGVDHIGVEVQYDYQWQTPLAALLNVSGADYTMVKGNAMRMEPVL
jgi:Flp pilus assembly protein TadG